MIRKQISIPTKDFDVLDALKRQPNASQYVIRLVREDQRKKTPKTREEMEALIREVCTNLIEKDPGCGLKVEDSIKGKDGAGNLDPSV
jgi:hypothetical protein